MSTTKEDEFDAILDMIWGEHAPPNRAPQTTEKAKVFREAFLTALGGEQRDSRVFNNPKTVAKVEAVRRTCLAKLKRQGEQPDLPWLPFGTLIVLVAKIPSFPSFLNEEKPAKLAFAYADGRFDGIKQPLQPKRDEVRENNAILRFHKKSDQHWVVSFLTASDELADKKLRLIMHEQSGKELVNEPQQLLYEDERWRFRYDVYLTDKQVQQVKTTITVE